MQLPDFVEILLLREKSELYQAVKNAITKLENQSGRKLKRFHSDNAKDYLNKEFETLFAEKGVVQTTTGTYAPEQNGLAERINRTLMDKVRALLKEANLPKIYWAEALFTAVYLYIRVPHSAISDTPYGKRFGTKPDLSNIRLFGSKALKLEHNLSKLDLRTSEWILIGFGSNQYKLLNPKTRKTTWSRDVTILEKEEKSNNIAENGNSGSEINENDEIQTEKELPITENRAKPTTFQEFIDQLNSEAEFAYSATISCDPITYKDAINHENRQEWLKSMESEVQDLIRKGTWILIERPEGVKVLPGRWVYKTKLDSAGNVQKRKSRWVARGDKQEFGINYFETFAHTAKSVIIRTLFAIAAIEDKMSENY